MKNIHILATSQPSILIKDVWKNTFSLVENFDTNHTDFKAQHIYITSDEEIKKGDWCLDKFNQRWKLEDKKLIAFDSEGIKRFSTDNILGHECKKIILSTDQELIKDGVQAIDDEFLEWFCNNSSCEFVEVNKMSYGYLSGFAHAGYKIIIQKEEPKQETIEETYNRVFDGKLDRVLKAGFVAGFSASTVTTRINEEQDKNKYSEKEVIDLWNWLNDGFIIRKSLPTKEELVGWFEQLKKK
jgi:hypothetical protein